MSALRGIQTADATPTAIGTIEIAEWTGGVVEVLVIGVEDAGTGAVTGKKIAGFFKTTTLTIDAPTDLLPTSGLIAGSFAINNVGEHIEITVTGVAATVINWVAEIKILTEIATNLA